MSALIAHLTPVLLSTHAAETPNGVDYLLHSNVFNVLLVAGILAWVFKKQNVGALIQRRQAQIAEEIQSVAAERAAALAQLEAIQVRTKGLSAEVDAILSNAQAAAEALSEQILRNAQEDANQFVEASRRRIELEEKAAFQALESRLLLDALQEARTTLTEELHAEEQKRSVEDFIEALSDLKMRTKD